MHSTSRAVGRPRAAGAARASILAAADRLFYEFGVDSVSLDQIARSAGVTRRTLYYHFSGKDQLVIEHVRIRDREIKTAARGASPLDAFTALERLFCSKEYRGCAITNVIFSGQQAPAVVGRMTARHKREIERWFIDEVARMNVRDAELVGRQLIILYEGAAIVARSRRDRDIPRIARRAAEDLLRLHGANIVPME